jgi:tetratricopeptide (TPR) repeat protein
VELLRQATQASPEDPEPYYWLAAAQRAAGDAPGVEASLLKALDLEPNHAPALLAMVRHMATEGRMEDVGAYLTRLRLVAPENPEVIRYDGLYTLAKGNPAEAVTLLEKAQGIEPSTTLAIDITRAKIAAGDWAGALQTIGAWNKEHPDDLVARFEEATLLQADGQHDEAVAAYKVILAKSPDSITSLNNLAWVLMLQGKTDEAMSYAQRAYGIDGRDPVVMDTLAALMLKQDKAAEALPLLRQASEALPGDPNVHVHLATALAKTGKKDEARDLLKQVLSAPVGDFETRAEGEALLAELGG